MSERASPARQRREQGPDENGSVSSGGASAQRAVDGRVREEVDDQGQPAQAQAGRVVRAATPLGNVGDASARLIAALRGSPVIAAEDTRRTRRLCADLGVVPAGRIVSFFEANET